MLVKKAGNCEQNPIALNKMAVTLKTYVVLNIRAVQLTQHPLL